MSVAATLPPTTPATTTASTSTSAGVARVTCVRTGSKAADVSTTVAAPRAMPNKGAPPVGASRFINTNLDAILTATHGLLPVPRRARRYKGTRAGDDPAARGDG